MSVESRGEKEVANTEQYSFTILGDEIFLLDDQNIDAAMKFDLDETRCPKQISLGMVKGIYDFKDGYLRICYTMNGKRPTMFATSEDRPNEVLMILHNERVPNRRHLPAAVSRRE